MDSSFAPFATHAYTDAGLDRSDPLRTDPAALALAWVTGQVMHLDSKGCALVSASGQLRWCPTTAVAGDVEQSIFLGIGRLDGVARFARVQDVVPTDTAVIALRDAATQWPAAEAAMFAYARAMLLWQQRTRFCSHCGGALTHVRAGFMGRCSACGSEHYPRVDPAIIVAVGGNGQLLLGRQAGWPRGRYSVIAGFVEPGETFEQTVCREVHEETQVVVDLSSCRYLGAQPWPFPGALMVGFCAQGQGQPQVDGELEDAQWFSRAAVGQALADEHPWLHLPPPLSIARSLIAHWHAGGGD